MSYSYNLIDQPFIPVVDLNGVSREVSLWDALIKASSLSRISASLPHTNAALYRLLLAVLHRVFGPATPGDWERLWQRGAFDPRPLEIYLHKWYSRFDLFASVRPFFQSRHPDVEIKPANDLLLFVAGGDADTLFDHNVDTRPVVLSPAEAALALITTQSFGLAGLCHPQKKLVYTDAPCARAVVILLQGNNLFESLMLNLVVYNRKEPFEWQKDFQDLPAWEMEDPYFPERTRPLGYLDFLTWHNRRLMLFPTHENGQLVVNQITTAPGLILSNKFLNPMHHYRMDEKQGYRVLRFTEGRALWRDSSALFNLTKGANIRPPSVLNHVQTLIFDDILPSRRLTLAAYGMSTDPGKQKVFFYRGEQFDFPDQLLNDQSLVSRLDQALDLAEQVHSQIGDALRRAASLYLAPEGDPSGGSKLISDDEEKLMAHWNTESLYWARLEVPFYRFLDQLVSEPDEAIKRWSHELRDAANYAFEHTISSLGSSARALKAVAQSRVKYLAGLKKVLNSDITGGKYDI